MFRSIRTLAAVVFGFAAVAFTGHSAKAQMMPMDGSGGWQDIAAANANFDRNFDIMARQASVAIARNMRPGEQLPFNAMTISHSISGGMRQFESNCAGWNANSNAQMNAVGNWTMGAIQGNGTYSNGSGPSYVMPYTYGAYNMQNGYMYGGYAPGGNNYYPTYRR